MIIINLFFSILQELALEVKKYKTGLVLRGKIYLTDALEKAVGKVSKSWKGVEETSTGTFACNHCNQESRS